MSGTSVMRSLVAVATFTCSVVAHPYPACEVCDAVSQVDLEALSVAGKVSESSMWSISKHLLISSGLIW